MSSHDDLLQQGIAAVRAGQLEQGRQLLAKAIQINPQSETAWIWMSGVVQTDEQRISCLQQVIAINPNNELALKGLQALGAMGAPSAPPPPPAPEPPPDMDMGMPAEPTPFGMASAPMDSGASFEEIGSLELPPAPVDSSADLLGLSPDATPPEAIHYDFGAEEAAPGVPPPPPPPPPRVMGPPPPAPDGIPLVDGMQITQAQREVENILRELRDRSLTQVPRINWAPPETLQTRERSLLSAFSPLAVVGVGGGVIVILSILISSIMIGIVTGRRPLSIGGGTGGEVGPIISTAQPTPLSTRTPTPAGTQFDPGPTIDAGAAPHGLPSFGKLTATPLYVNTPHPESPPLKDAVLAFGREDWITTLDGIQRARDVGVDSIDAYYMEGIALAHLGQEDRAIEAFNNGLDQNAEFAPFHAGLGYVYHLQGNAERARDNSEKAIQLDPKLVLPYLTLADLDVEEGEYNDALAVIKAGKENLGGYDVNLIVAEGEVYLAQENYKKAAELGNYAYYIDPTVEGPVLLVARARLGLELPEAAIITLQDYLDNYNPSSAEGWALLSKAYSAVGRRADALTANSRALQLSGNAVDALVTRGKLYLDQGKYELACEDLNAAVENDETNFEARLGRAKCSYFLGDSETAVEDIEYIRSVSSGSSELDMLYVQALVAEERWEDAITAGSNAYNRGRLTQAQYGNVLEAQGYAFYQVGDYNNAFTNLEAAIRVEQTGTRHYYRGLIYEALGDYQRAAWSYEWVLYWNSIYNYPFAEDAAERLAKVSGQANVTPTPSPTPSPTPTTTPTPAASPSATPTPTAGTPSVTPTKTPTPGQTGTPKGTNTPRPSGTPKGTSTPKPTGTP